MKIQELMALIDRGYDAEMSGLSYIANSDLLPTLLHDIMNYEDCLNNKSPSSNADKFIHSVTSDTNIIRTTSVTAELNYILLLSHLACCCELLNGMAISSSTLKNPSLPGHIHRIIQHALKQTPNNVYSYVKRLNNADTVRTIQMLRLLGLLDLRSQNCRQLSLGAGFGRKDIYAVHAIPRMSSNPNKDTPYENSELLFSTSSTNPAQITLIDNDKSLVDLYKNYNLGSNGSIHAILDDATHALDKLPALIDKKAIKPFNMIIGIRVDHRMIAEIEDFFVKLTQVMEPQADFVISVGAGFSASEFEGRVNLISGIFDHLKDKGLDPVRIILHSGNTLKESRERPAFGYVAIATHEILYCRLHRDNLA
jgi:hypothetical protein